MNMEPVRRSDYFAVGIYCLVLFGFLLAAGGPLTLHEGVLSQTTKAMLQDGDWLVPHYASAPWLERPPLPQWISCGVSLLVGTADQEWVLRIGPALAGTLTVLLTVWLAGRLFGRVQGILSGLILATMYNFARYSTLAEADMILAPIVGGVLCLFAHNEILRGYLPGDSCHFLGKRSLGVLAFFVVLGMTNLAKGLVFGTVMALAPVGIFLLWNFRWQALGRYTWFWGWLVFAGIALAWPLAVLQKHPDALELWHFDLVGRLQQHYLEEPSWYYFASLGWVLLPWTGLAFLGLYLSAGRAFREKQPADQLVWCWAWMPILVFSLSQGKHHHYMIHFLAPWAMLSAGAAIWIWQKLSAHWQSRWSVPTVLSLALDAVVLALGRNLTDPAWLIPGLLVAVPALVFGLWTCMVSPRPRIALYGSFAILLVLYCGGFFFKAQKLHRSMDDTVFLGQVRDLVGPDQPLCLHSCEEALEGLRMQYYLGQPLFFLHNLSFLRDDRIPQTEVFLVTRFKCLPEVEKYGQAAAILQSKKSRREESPADRWTLFRVRLREDLERKSGQVRISPMQAMYRHPGPNLD